MGPRLLVLLAALAAAGATEPRIPSIGSDVELMSPWEKKEASPEAAPAEKKVGVSNGTDCGCHNSTNSSNATGLLALEEMMESEGGLTTAGVVMSAAVFAGLAVGSWQGFKWLTSPKRTPAPLLADTELGEGDPVNPSDSSSLWMGGSGPARELMSSSSAGFTQF
ncbi:unnamed protein product [Polarella glacialis]|uniref:Uncharacterized protein n=1 Tax=Polarella glacialis TaxID=89957 RepID=A0A813IMC1_POLGL|nr:unnamed protein product [Polarella glacialis]CAE8651663.1 unnamed protein product [Polarella glacialis]|mmetsp:Transcript_54025/g.87334  ORF Transcript_54025/g.87334 Transcript_54025/m.87334 type:complete len:165 (+) Transcript_54025:55-549(+)